MEKISLLIITTITLLSCTSKNSKTFKEDNKNRIKIQEERVISGHLFLIIKIDSTEFITSGDGGFYKL